VTYLINILLLDNKLIDMKSKSMLTTSIVMTVLMIGLISSPLASTAHAIDYNDGYKDYGRDMPDNNGYQEYNKVKVFPPSGELTADWWQWILDIPKEINPLLDETGENCGINQQGPVWYLVGTPGDSETGGIITGSVVRDDCVIPEGKKILFPIINTFCSELNDEAAIKEALGIPEDQPIPPSQLAEGLSLCAKNLIDGVDILEASIDGKNITNFEDFRVQSPVFTIVYPEDNVFDVTDFTDIPQKAVSDGYWVLVKGLEPGEHEIKFRGGISGVFETDVTYHLTIEPDNNNDYGYNNNNDYGYNNNNDYGSNDNGYDNNYYY
jgi:hypothetical protein